MNQNYDRSIASFNSLKSPETLITDKSELIVPKTYSELITPVSNTTILFLFNLLHFFFLIMWI